MQKKPMSSSACIASDLPAPESPVTIKSSIDSLLYGSGREPNS